MIVSPVASINARQSVHAQIATSTRREPPTKAVSGFRRAPSLRRSDQEIARAAHLAVALLTVGLGCTLTAKALRS